MDAVEFLKARRRMCETNDCNKGGCPLFEHNCDNGTDEENAQTVAIVEQWAKEHPVKTRQSELLKLFPDASMLYDGYLNICPAQISSECRDKETGGCYDSGMDCSKCKHDFWLKEIE